MDTTASTTITFPRWCTPQQELDAQGNCQHNWTSLRDELHWFHSRFHDVYFQERVFVDRCRFCGHDTLARYSIDTGDPMIVYVGKDKPEDSED